MNIYKVNISSRVHQISFLWFLCVYIQLGIFTGTSTECSAAAVCREIIIGDLLSGSILSIFRGNDLQTDVPPAGIHQGLTENCNIRLCQSVGSSLLTLMIFALKWPPIIVFFLSCLPDVISPAKWRAGNPCVRAFTGSDCETLGREKWKKKKKKR